MGNRLTLFFLAFSFLGCAGPTAHIYRGTSGGTGAALRVTPAPDFSTLLDLDVCLFLSNRPVMDGYGTRYNLGFLMDGFETNKAHIAQFRAVRNVKSLEDADGIYEAGCDIVVEIGAIASRPGMWVFSARTTEQLFRTSFTGIPLNDWAVPLRKALYTEFKTNPKLLARIVAERGEPLSAVAHIHSDIDTPDYRMKARPDDFAIIVGIDRYKNLPAAQFAERDAETMHSHILALGFPERHVILLKGKDATGNSMRKYLDEWLPRNVKPTSTVFFFYSGHGASDTRSGKAYLVPWDGDAQFLRSTAYPLGKLYSSLNSLRAKQVVIALDTCFSGAGGRSVLAKGARPLVTTVADEKVPGGKLVLFMAAATDEITSISEKQGHGIFTYYFIKGLNGAAMNAVGKVTAKSLYRYLKPKVQNEAHLQNREQTPSVQYRKNVVLRGN